jgi:hypothetical protein
MQKGNKEKNKIHEKKNWKIDFQFSGGNKFYSKFDDKSYFKDIILSESRCSLKVQLFVIN